MVSLTWGAPTMWSWTFKVGGRYLSDRAILKLENSVKNVVLALRVVSIVPKHASWYRKYLVSKRVSFIVIGRHFMP